MEWLRIFWSQRKSEHNERREKMIRERAKELYQIVEYENQLWFTYNGSLFAPCSLIVGNEKGEFSSTECVAMLNTIRSLYVSLQIQK
jgi:hypothetical protein